MTQLILEGISQKWLDIIYTDETKTLLDSIVETLESVETTPLPAKWFEWARLTDVDDIKCVLLGQDPYPKDGWAHGLSFSCKSDVPPSLKNIYKCLMYQELISEMPVTGDLTTWAMQGVLMLNAGLTTIAGTTAKHMKYWKPYTTLIIQRLCEYYENKGDQITFMLWGNFAKKFSDVIDEDFHIVLNWIHPSPLAQNSAGPADKFINCSHFADLNKFLVSEGHSPIDWDPIGEDTPEDALEKNDEQPGLVQKMKTFKITPLKHSAFTDGGAHPNNKSINSVAGYASVFVSGPLRDTRIYGNLCNKEHNASNIRAEGMAIIRTLELVNKCKDPWDEFDIITDCKFWVDMLERYMPRWDSTKFKEKSNPDLTMRLWRVWKAVGNKGVVRVLHMNSHGKSGWNKFPEGSYERYCYEQNDYVDKLCNYSRLDMEKGDEIIDTVEYH